MSSKKHLWVIIMMLIILTPSLANASLMGDVKGLMCSIVKLVNGTIARTMATFGIVFMGVGAFFGKLTWGTVLIITFSVMIIFGSATIVSNFSMDTNGQGYINMCGT